MEKESMVVLNENSIWDMKIRLENKKKGNLIYMQIHMHNEN